MIQLNLLPDVKLEYIKAEQTRRVVTVIAVLVTIASIAILVLMLGYDVYQKHSLSRLNTEINSEVATLNQKPDITKILTVQNQLESLTALHASKPAANRLFDTYLDEITPENVSLTDLNIDFTQDTAIFTGTADSLSTVNKYVDTLKFTKYTSDQVPSPTNAFSNVVLSSFGVNPTATDASSAANFVINLSFDKNIFDITQKVNLTVPNLITTRSALAQPGDLFKSTSSSNKSGGQ